MTSAATGLAVLVYAMDRRSRWQSTSGNVDREAFAERAEHYENVLDDPERATLLALRPDNSSAAAIGKRYLTENPRASSETAILRNLRRKLSPDGTPLNEVSYDALYNRLDIAIEHDFLTGRSLAVSGWILAATEIELCSLVALIESKVKIPLNHVD